MKRKPKFFLVVTFCLAHLAHAGFALADSLSEEVALQISDLDGKVWPESDEYACKVIWRTVEVQTTGKDHMHQWVVLRDLSGVLEKHEWSVTAHYRSTAPGEQIDNVLRLNEATQASDWAGSLVGNSDAFVAGWDLVAGKVEREVVSLKREGRYLLGYYPIMGVRASFVLEMDGSQHALGELQANYPGS